MQPLDKGNYDYFRTLNQINCPAANSAAPTNPLSNFSGNVFGYSGAHSRHVCRTLATLNSNEKAGLNT
ncbi:hypothetical protein CDA63_03620 [Hymenobacter amundsenii]|uniref:Uncharacterized protein n=1 Tax=Hymenobacter amundsenii TaxID=2006685 RepID=A0A246FP24_9BACT|nr:hypothetical protein [Hymenobacter amundsenii]OWP64470.1 hypothetical protein CDA63_03620 [Hymenobacter amundsenii]